MTTLAARPSLTERQREYLVFIRLYRQRHGYMPTVRDLCVGLDVKSPNGVTAVLDALVAKGYLQRDRRAARGMRLIGGDTQAEPAAEPAAAPTPPAKPTVRRHGRTVYVSVPPALMSLPQARMLHAELLRNIMDAEDA